jgi:glycosyltransferase involved in cell wall biosynthesis
MYSVIIPIFNEERILPELRSRLAAATAGLDEPHEVIFIDDGSRDGSYALMTAMNTEDPRIKVIRLSRNFGHQIAISAGLDEARGDAVVLMDGDLQDPPELLPAMIRLWKEGFQASCIPLVLQDPPCTLDHSDSYGRREFFVDGQAGRRRSPGDARTKQVYQRTAGMGRVPANRDCV